MIVQFITSNFRALRQAADLSLLEANITEFQETLIRSQLDGSAVLPVSLLYGANGSGKSTVLEAIVYLKELISDPEHMMKKSCSFYGADSVPTSFDLVLRNEEREYEYILKLLNGNVTEETLFARKLSEPTYTIVFDRDKDGVFLGDGLDHIDVSPLKDEKPMLSFVLEQIRTNMLLNEVRDMIMSLKVTDCSLLDDEPIHTVLADDARRELFMQMLTNVQSGITGIEETKESILVMIKGMQLGMEKLGKGLQQLMRLYALAADALSTGATLLLDDVNQKLHPKAFKFLLQLFTDRSVNVKGAQLIGTSYDMPTMANSVLRRDEIWITDCAPNGESRLYPLALFVKENGEKVRKDETYFKQFLEGRYGTDIVPAPMH